ncbi:MAG: Lrp/AsnC family transcriptional regulator [Pseudomonadota bacterium]
MNIDALDRKILGALQRDASKPAEQVGEEIGLSRNACWRRIKRLEENGVIARRVALLDAGSLNLGLTVFVAIRTRSHTSDWLETFKLAVRDIPEITGVYRMSGETDYLLRASVPDMKAYDGLYRRLIAKIELEDVSSSFVMETIKETTELPLGYA